jgi:hypothetical protein
MNPRQPRVHWIRRPKGEKDLLVFDAGYERGQFHTYEHKESIKIEEISETNRRIVGIRYHEN